MDKKTKPTKGPYFVSDTGPRINQELLKRHLDELAAQDDSSLSLDEVSRRRKRREDAYITAVLNGQDPNGIY